jgi:hypothetical protein
MPFLKIFKKISTKTFDINTQYKFLLIKKKLEEDQKLIQEQAELIAQQFGEKNEQGQIIQTQEGGIKILPEKQQECITQVQKLNNQQIQLPDIYFTFDELDGLDLTLTDLEILEPFIKV